MEKVDVGQLTKWSDGTVVRGSSHTKVQSISTDTRQAMPGGFFVPLIGERFDGHDFILDAIAQGAQGTFCSQKRLSSVLKRLSKAGVSSSFTVVSVVDTLSALQAVARGYRATFDMPVIGVTGSNGKTTTKEMIAAMLSTQYPVAWTRENLNNQIGVPLTLFEMEHHLGAMVVEMGTNAPGEIATLAAIAQPTVGVVTNVGPVHLEGLGDVSDVATEKAALIEALLADGIAVINADDQGVLAMAKLSQARVVTYGFDKDAHVRAENVETRGLEGTRFVICYGEKRFPAFVRMAGRHHVTNALAAAAVTLSFDLPHAAVQEGLLRLQPASMRMQVRHLGKDVVLIDDAYNASPLSMAAAVETLVDISNKRRVAILGGMLELGPQSKTLHQDVGALVAKGRVDLLVTIGNHGQWIMDGALAAGMSIDRIRPFSDVEEADAMISSIVQPGDVILLKASRGYQLERLAKRLQQYLGENPKS